MYSVINNDFNPVLDPVLDPDPERLFRIRLGKKVPDSTKTDCTTLLQASGPKFVNV
jgi:hypothetical protein